MNPLKILQIACQIVIASVFIYTGIIKLTGWNAWIGKVYNISFIETYHLIFIAYLLPFAEILVAIGLFIKGLKKEAAYLALFLMLVFTAYIYYKVYVWEDSLCPCGGIFSQLTLDKHLWVNIGLTVIALTLVWAIHRIDSRPNKTNII